MSSASTLPIIIDEIERECIEDAIRDVADIVHYNDLEREAVDYLVTVAKRYLERAMKPWNGGHSAPSDWDGGAVLLRDGALWNAKTLWWQPEPANPNREIIAYSVVSA